MKEHKIKGSFIKRFFNEEGEGKVLFPSSDAELKKAYQVGIKAISPSGKEKVFPYKEEDAFSDMYRGFSLSGQQAAPLSEEEKKAAKEKRQAGNSLVKQFAGMDRAKQDSILAALKAAGHDVSAMEKLLSPA